MKKQILSAVTAGILAVSMAAPVVTAFADNEVTDSSQVTLTGTKTPITDPTGAISMTVPTTIPLGVNASTHAVSTGNNLTIKNTAPNTNDGKDAKIQKVTITDTSADFTFVSTSLGSEVGKDTAKNKIYAKIFDAANESTNYFTLNDTTKTFTNWTVAKGGGSVTLSASGDTGALTDSYSDEGIATVSWEFAPASA